MTAPAPTGRRGLLLWGGLSLALHGALLAAWEAPTAPNSPSASPGRLRITVAATTEINPAEAAAPRGSVTEKVAIAKPMSHSPSPPLSSRSGALPETAKTSAAAAQGEPVPTRERSAPARIAAAAPAAGSATTAPPPGGASESLVTEAPLADEDRLVELYRLLHAAIDRHKRYPLSALRLGREGRARVDFRLLPDGEIRQVQVTASSGTAALDRAALAAVRAIAPFTPAARYLAAAEPIQVDIVFRRYPE